MELKTLGAQSRAKDNGRSNGRMRRSGRVPAIVYGGGGEPAMLSVDNHEIEMLIGGASRTTKIFAIDCDGQKTNSIIREMQRHPVSSRLVHIDFQRIDITQQITMMVPVHLEGTPSGVRAGGVLEHIAREVEVRCLPLNTPHHISVDVRGLGMNQSLHVSDLVAPEGVTILSDPEDAVAIVAPPRAEAEAAVVEGAAEPELVKKEKKAKDDDKKDAKK